MTGQAGVDREAIYGHLRAWGVKTFFLAFMLAIVPPGFGDFVRGDVASVLRDPVALSSWLVTLMFLIDVAFATVGYLLRSARSIRTSAAPTRSRQRGCRH